MLSRCFQVVYALEPLQPGADTSAIAAELNNELLVLARARCNHIVKLLGIVRSPLTRQPKMIIMESARCNLRVYLNRLRAVKVRQRLPLRALRRIWVHVLYGLQYLHANLVVHGGLKLENVLVFFEDGDETCVDALFLKLSDAGFTRIVAKIHSKATALPICTASPLESV